MPYENRGVIERTVGDSLVYAVSRENGRSFSITPGCFDGFVGQNLAELGLGFGTEISFELDSDGRVTRAQLEQQTRPRGFRAGESAPAAQLPPPVPSERVAATSPRFELHPQDAPVGTTSALRALPAVTRLFGKLIGTDVLRAGDLLLTREAQPEDTVCGLIAGVQAQGGYAATDAQWVHAAMYLGDGTFVVEATVDGLLTGGNVRLTTLDDYCKGDTVLRFRRPKAIQDEHLGWKMCVRAMSRLGQGYNIMAATQMWFDVVVRSGGFFDQKKRATSAAVVCSTLYADSYNEATRHTLGEVNGACVPAFLSLSDAFDDVQVGWLQIV